MGVSDGAPFPAGRRAPGQSVADVIADTTRAFAAQRGVDLSWASTDQMMRLHQYSIFPNMTLLANADHLTVMASRPGPIRITLGWCCSCGHGCHPVHREQSRQRCE